MSKVNANLRKLVLYFWGHVGKRNQRTGRNHCQRKQYSGSSGQRFIGSFRYTGDDCIDGKTARLSVAPYLEEWQSTVGTLVNIKHLSASPVGMTITCKTELVDIDRRRLVFHVECYDTAGLIGEGDHERFIIDEAKFMAKTDGKLQ